VSEETILRGYAIERLQEITKSTWIGASIAYALDLLVHVPAWGVAGSISRAPALFVFVCLYLWRRNLAACILAHVLADGFALVLWPILPTAFQVYFAE
jgi:membrane protease YdiL (CAAX protease family)